MGIKAMIWMELTKFHAPDISPVIKPIVKALLIVAAEVVAEAASIASDSYISWSVYPDDSSSLIIETQVRFYVFMS